MEGFSKKKKVLWFYDYDLCRKAKPNTGLQKHTQSWNHKYVQWHTHAADHKEMPSDKTYQSSWQDTEGVRVQLQEWYIIHMYTHTGQKCWFSSALADLRTETGSKGPTTCDTIHKSGTSSRKHSVCRRCYSFHNEGYHLAWRTIW